MANSVIVIDTSILIDFYRKSDKNNSVWIALIRQGYDFAVSAVTKYEIYSGATESQLSFWNEVFRAIEVLPLDERTVDTAVVINASLKRKRKQIDLADLLIAATAVSQNHPFATLNRKHFERVDTLILVD